MSYPITINLVTRCVTIKAHSKQRAKYLFNNFIFNHPLLSQYGIQGRLVLTNPETYKGVIADIYAE